MCTELRKSAIIKLCIPGLQFVNFVMGLKGTTAVSYLPPVSPTSLSVHRPGQRHSVGANGEWASLEIGWIISQSKGSTLYARRIC